MNSEYSMNLDCDTGIDEVAATSLALRDGLSTTSGPWRTLGPRLLHLHRLLDLRLVQALNPRDAPDRIYYCML